VADPWDAVTALFYSWIFCVSYYGADW
jgi:hypothetical protein